MNSFLRKINGKLTGAGLTAWTASSDATDIIAVESAGTALVPLTFDFIGGARALAFEDVLLVEG